VSKMRDLPALHNNTTCTGWSYHAYCSHLLTWRIVTMFDLKFAVVFSFRELVARFVIGFWKYVFSENLRWT
jgi:hypothetical protein